MLVLFDENFFSKQHDRQDHQLVVHQSVSVLAKIATLTADESSEVLLNEKHSRLGRQRTECKLVTLLGIKVRSPEKEVRAKDCQEKGEEVIQTKWR